ncbi:hypothetical protein GCM10010417_30090 [Streptomyces carpaticus]
MGPGLLRVAGAVLPGPGRPNGDRGCAACALAGCTSTGAPAPGPGPALDQLRGDRRDRGLDRGRAACAVPPAPCRLRRDRRTGAWAGSPAGGRGLGLGTGLAW